MEEHLDELIEKSVPTSMPAEKRQKTIDRIKKWVYEGILPSGEELGITKEIKDNLYAFGYRLYSLGKYKDASIVFNWLSLFDTANYNYHFALASSFHMLKQYEDAIQAYIVTIGLDFNNPLPSFHMADCYIKIKNPELASYCLDLAMLQAGNNPQFKSVKERAALMKQGIKGSQEKKTAEVTS